MEMIWSFTYQQSLVLDRLVEEYLTFRVPEKEK